MPMQSGRQYQQNFFILFSGSFRFLWSEGRETRAPRFRFQQTGSIAESPETPSPECNT